jgi:hypothetical protein
MVVAACAVITSSCGDNSTDKTASEDSLTTTTTNNALSDNTNNNTGQTVNTGIEVKPETKTSFETKYPKASEVVWRRYEPVPTIDWEWTGWPAMDTSDYAVSFDWDGTDYWAWYDENNNWVGSITTITDFSTLPPAVNDRIKSDFDGYTIVSVDKENDKNRTAYEIELSKGTDSAKILVDESGKILKKKTNADGVKTKEKTK